MKKIILGLSIGLASVTSWSACTYNFDMTKSQLDLFNKNAQISIFPQNANQTLSFKMTAGPYLGGGTGIGYIGASSQVADEVAKSPPNSNVKGDKILPSDKVFAYEIKLKTPNNLNGETSIWSLPTSAFGKLENGNNFATSIMLIDGMSTDTGSRTKKIVLSIGTIEESLPYSLEIQPTAISDGILTLGFYVNQNSRQVGLIVNGKNYGYVHTLPSKVKNLGFLVNSLYGTVHTLDLGKEVSTEVITDKSKMNFTYLTGTTDICGTTL